MDIELMSKMVRELILDHDAVTLPGVGSFVAELAPSTFSDRGYTINPPYRRLSFRPREEADSLLVELYAHSNNLDFATAESLLKSYLSEMKELLKERKTIVFPGLGRLRATKENNFFFIADEDLNIYPDGFGLKPLSLKTHVETDDEVSAAVAELRSFLNDDAEDDTADSVPMELEQTMGSDGVAISNEQSPEPACEEKTEMSGGEEGAEMEYIQRERRNEEALVKEAVYRARRERKARQAKKARRFWLAVLIIFSALILLAAIYMVLGRIAPDFIDRLLYSEKELEILHHHFTIEPLQIW